jgi:aromatic ring-opening dioxygenase LigB subunit
MPIVFACIAPHGGHLLIGPPEVSPIPASRAAMETMRAALEAAKADTLAILTPHGIYAEGLMTLGISPVAYGELDELCIEARTDIDLASAWAYHGSDLGIPVAPVAPPDSQPFPLDWGVTIPLALLDPEGLLPIVAACPARDLSRRHLVDWGEALALASDEQGRRVALIVSADQGHGHAADGPYGFTPASAEYDRAMIEAVGADDLDRLLTWDDAWIEAGLPDSYWQTLSLIGARRRASLKSTFLSYEVDHYFGLLCAMYA